MDSRLELHKIVRFLMEQVREEQRLRTEALTGKIARWKDELTALDVEARIEEVREYVRVSKESVH